MVTGMQRSNVLDLRSPLRQSRAHLGITSALSCDVMMDLQHIPFLLILSHCCLLRSSRGFLAALHTRDRTHMIRPQRLGSNGAWCARQRAIGDPPARWRSGSGSGGSSRNSSAPEQQPRRHRPFWIRARGGGEKGNPPPLAAGAGAGADAAEKTSLFAGAESAHLKLRTTGRGTGAQAMAETRARPWKWIVVDERGLEEDEKEEENAMPEAGENTQSSEAVDSVKAPAAGSAGAGEGVAESENTTEGDRNDNELSFGKVRLLEYRASPGAGGEKGETLYASLGEDVSKFIIYLESAVARGGRDGDDGGGGGGSGKLEPTPAGPSGEVEEVEAVAIAAAAPAVAKGIERRIFVSTVEVGDERAQQDLRALWEQGRLLSQERDAVNILRGREQNFSELLASYTKRTKLNHWETIPPERLLETLESGHGAGARSHCGYDPARQAGETLSSIKAVLEWFKKDFPYYYDRCHSCGNDVNNTFVGYVNPTALERELRAGRTELYHCSACGSVSRFPRYVAVSKVLDTRRGRCGEYSVLMMRLLEALGYSCRWVVDWSDHVWVEAKVDGLGWVHVDPCEAAVDEPLLYESWGKKQTYILAFTPTEVVDVTEHYTSDYEAAKARREVDQETMTRLLAEATKTLQEP